MQKKLQKASTQRNVWSTRCHALLGGLSTSSTCVLGHVDALTGGGVFPVEKLKEREALDECAKNCEAAMKPTVKVDGRGISVQLDAIRKQHRFATALALTRTAQDVKAAEEDAMRRSIDRPTPYTMKSLFLKPARRDSLVARVWLKDDAGKGTPAEKYLLPQIIGGGRRVKRFERALQAAGIMPQGMQAVPGRRARRDAYGNVSTGQIRQILSQLRIQLTAGYESRTSLDPRKKRRAIKRADGQFFAITQRRGKLPPGIYQRRLYSSGFGSVTPEAVFLFKPAVRYTPRFDFFGVAERTVRERFPTRFAEAWAQAKATAR